MYREAPLEDFKPFVFLQPGQTTVQHVGVEKAPPISYLAPPVPTVYKQALAGSTHAPLGKTMTMSPTQRKEVAYLQREQSNFQSELPIRSIPGVNGMALDPALVQSYAMAGNEATFRALGYRPNYPYVPWGQTEVYGMFDLLDPPNTKTMTVHDFLIAKYGDRMRTPYLEWFLSEDNMKVIQRLMTNALLQETENPDVLLLAGFEDNLVPYSNAILDSLMHFAWDTNLVAVVDENVMMQANDSFVQSVIEGLVMEYGGHRTLYQRFMQQGYPSDAAVIGRVLPSEKRSFTQDTGSYVTSHPFNNGGRHPRY